MTQPSEQSGQPIKRIQQNLLAASERRLLTWLCQRLPSWATPDLLTAIGMVGAVIVFAGYWLSAIDSNWLWLAIAGLAVQWFGDSLDGSVARFRGIERPSFGYFIDHSCDGLATLFIMGGIGLSPFVRLHAALLCLIGYLLLSIHAFLAARVIGELPLSHLGAGPTELRLVLVAITVAMMALGPKPAMLGPLSAFDLLFGGVGILLILLFVVQTLRTARTIDEQEKAGR